MPQALARWGLWPVLWIVAMAFGLASCGGDDDESSVPSASGAGDSDTSSGCGDAGPLTRQALPQPDDSEILVVLENPCVPLTDLAGAVLDAVPQADGADFTAGLRSLVSKLIAASEVIECGYETDRLAVRVYQHQDVPWSAGAFGVLRGDLAAAFDIGVCYVKKQLSFLSLVATGPLPEFCVGWDRQSINGETYSRLWVGSSNVMCGFFEGVDRQSGVPSVTGFVTYAGLPPSAVADARPIINFWSVAAERMEPAQRGYDEATGQFDAIGLEAGEYAVLVHIDSGAPGSLGDLSPGDMTTVGAMNPTVQLGSGTAQHEVRVVRIMELEQPFTNRPPEGESAFTVCRSATRLFDWVDVLHAATYDVTFTAGTESAEFQLNRSEVEIPDLLQFSPEAGVSLRLTASDETGRVIGRYLMLFPEGGYLPAANFTISEC